MPFLVKAQVDISTLSWKTGKRLNIPVSDHSATIGSNGKIYIAGGCISAAGNKYDDFIQVFQCGAITKELYVFEPMANTYVKMQDLPRARYRHAAAWANGRLWLIGGRDLQGNSGGNMILEIDVSIVSVLCSKTCLHLHVMTSWSRIMFLCCLLI
jgi:hypothetical protein